MFITCLGIFLARTIDVSLGTVKMVYSVKGKTLISAVIAFFEIFIWFMVAREALNTEINTIWIPISYSLGYAVGTLAGTFIANTFIKGLICVQIITKKNNLSLINKIRDKGYGLSAVALKNDYDDVKKEMLFVEINKRNLKDLTAIVKAEDDSAFLMVNETKIVQNGFMK